MERLARSLIVSLAGTLLINSLALAQVQIAIPELTESSGLAFSTRTDDLLFSHNDSGDGPRLFAFDRTGKLTYELQVEKAQAVDWEDMCAFEHDGKSWLAIGDIGDNQLKRASVSIYVVKEPNKKAGDKKRSSEVDFELKVKYPHGAVNSESLAYDPIRHSFLLLSKENLSCAFYEVEIPADPKRDVEVEAKLVGQLSIPMVTGAAISRDGKRLAICTYGPSCMIDRTSNQEKPWAISAEQLATKFFPVPSRRQGEAICFSPAGDQVWLTSEHLPTPLIEVQLPRNESR